MRFEFELPDKEYLFLRDAALVIGQTVPELVQNIVLKSISEAAKNTKSITNFERICNICEKRDKQALSEELDAWFHDGLAADGCFYDTSFNSRYNGDMMHYLDDEVPM